MVEFFSFGGGVLSYVSDLLLSMLFEPFPEGVVVVYHCTWPNRYRPCRHQGGGLRKVPLSRVVEGDPRALVFPITISSMDEDGIHL